MNTPPKHVLKALGPTGPSVSALGLGSWHTWDRMVFDDVVQVIRTALDAGINLFDVAYYNSGPHSDNSPTDLIFGRAMRAAGAAREDYVFCGKLFLWEYPQQSFTQQMTALLERVGIARADTAVLSDYPSIDIPAVVSDVAEQIRAGRLGSWGVNNWPVADLQAAITFAHQEGMPAPTFAQLKYGIARRSMAEGAFYGPLFSAGTLGLQASDVFEGGMLAGKKLTTRQIGADPGRIREQIRDAADEVGRIAAGFGATPAQLGIAFCLGHPQLANILFGVSSLAQLQENLGGLALHQKHGAEVRAAVEHLWLDRDRARADGVRTP